MCVVVQGVYFHLTNITENVKLRLDSNLNSTVFETVKFDNTNDIDETHYVAI